MRRIADYFYAHHLGADEDLREEGIGSDPVIAKVHRQLAEAGSSSKHRSMLPKRLVRALSDRMMHKIEEDASVVLLAAKKAWRAEMSISSATS